MKKANKKELNPFEEVEIQNEFNDDETIFESAENIEEVEVDEETNNETE